MGKKSLFLIGVASGIGAGNTGCGDGPLFLRENNYFESLKSNNIDLHWHKMLEQECSINKTLSVYKICYSLAKNISNLVKKKKFFSVIGGDHSCAIGTWSGAFAALNPMGEMGLLWIDAHLDSHTFETTPTGNIHGMPLAALLGHGNHLFKDLMVPYPKLSPKNVCVIGARSFEREELELLLDLGVHIFSIEEVKSKGLLFIMQQAYRIVSENTAGYGISIDLDAIDPLDAPGVGTPVQNGIRLKDLLRALRIIKSDPKLLGFEIVEFNPHLDIDRKTAKLIEDLLITITSLKFDYSMIPSLSYSS